VPPQRVDAAQLRGLEAVEYARVSKVGERGELLISPDTQTTHMDRYADTHELVVVERFLDLDETGRSFEKRKIQEIISGIKAGRWQVVLVWKYSRWGRNEQLSKVYIAKVEAAGGTVISVTEPIDASTAIGSFQRDLVLRLDELQSDLIGESWKDAQAHRRSKGLPHHGRQRFGYTYTKGQGYEISPATAPFVREAYERYIGGASIRGIVHDWNSRGLRTESMKSRPNGEHWSPQSLMYLLDTGFAAGLIREHSKPGTPETRRSSATFDVWRDGCHEPIIDRALWDAYRAKRAANALLAPRVRTATHALSSLLSCALCGGRLTSTYSHSKTVHTWTCLKGRNTRCHPPVSIGNAFVLLLVAEWLNANAEGGGDFAAQATAIAASRQQATTRSEQSARDLDKLLRRRRRLVELYETGDIEIGDYRAMKAKRDAEIVDAEAAQRAAMLDAAVQMNPEPAVFRTLLEEWEQTPPHAQRGALARLVRTIEVGPGTGRRQSPELTRLRVRIVPRWEQ
jgi:site-specific DNA recombinase